MQLVVFAAAAVILLSGSADAQTRAVANDWHDGLQERVAADLAAGKPLVVHVHVPLCDNRIIRCGGHGLGDGDNPRTNLYWNTSGGFLGWMNRRGSGWKQIHKAIAKGSKADVLDTRVWRRRIKPAAAWNKRGVDKSFDVIMVAMAWRGTRIRQAMRTYQRQLLGATPHMIQTSAGDPIAAGGAAHVVAYVGHNGWMDVDLSKWKFAAPASRSTDELPPKGNIAIACITEDYLAAKLSSKRAVPLLMTRSLLFAGAHAFEGAVTAFARGGDLARIRVEAAKNYAKGQGKTYRRVNYAFTNPAHSKWKRR